MGFFDGFVSIVFKKDAAERMVFYPWSIFGAGYFVPSEEKYRSICTLFKKMAKIFIPLFIVTFIALEWVELPKFQWVFELSLTVLFLIIIGLGYFISTRKITKDLTKTPEKIQLSDIYEEMATSYGIPVLIMVEVFSLIFVVCGIWFLLIDEYVVTAWITVLLFALLGYIVKNIIAKKIQQLK